MGAIKSVSQKLMDLVGVKEQPLIHAKIIRIDDIEQSIIKEYCYLVDGSDQICRRFKEPYPLSHHVDDDPQFGVIDSASPGTEAENIGA
jgi:hypothetical protein